MPAGSRPLATVLSAINQSKCGLQLRRRRAVCNRHRGSSHAPSSPPLDRVINIVITFHVVSLKPILPFFAAASRHVARLRVLTKRLLIRISAAAGSITYSYILLSSRRTKCKRRLYAMMSLCLSVCLFVCLFACSSAASTRIYSSGLY